MKSQTDIFLYYNNIIRYLSFLRLAAPYIIIYTTYKIRSEYIIFETIIIMTDHLVIGQSYNFST